MALVTGGSTAPLLGRIGKKKKKKNGQTRKDWEVFFSPFASADSLKQQSLPLNSQFTSSVDETEL